MGSMTDQYIYISTGPFTIQQQHMMEFLPVTNNMVPKKLNGIRGVNGGALDPEVDPKTGLICWQFGG